MGYIWHWFLELHRTRGGNGFGPNPIGYTEMDAWQRVTGRCLGAWELDAIFSLDAAYMASIPDPKSEAE